MLSTLIAFLLLPLPLVWCNHHYLGRDGELSYLEHNGRHTHDYYGEHDGRHTHDYYGDEMLSINDQKQRLAAGPGGIAHAQVSSLAQTVVRDVKHRGSSLQEDDDDEEAETTETETTTEDPNYKGKEVNKYDDPTYALGQAARNFPDMSEPVKYGTYQKVQYDVFTPKARKRAEGVYANSRARNTVLADQDDDRHTVTLSDVFTVHHTIFNFVLTCGLAGVIVCFCCSMCISSTSKYHPWVPIIYQPNRKTLTMRQQLEIEGSDSPRKEAAAKLMNQRNSEYFDIHSLGGRGGGARAFNVSEEAASEYTSIDAGQYERDGYSVENKVGKGPKDKFGRAVGKDEADLIKNENEMANIKYAISDEGSHYGSN